MTEEEEKEVETMCNLSQAVKEKKEKEVNIRVATDMLKDGKPITEIEKYSRLSQEVSNTIAFKTWHCGGTKLNCRLFHGSSGL